MSLIPGSREWHEWRKLGIGGSDAPVIMGVGRKSILALWEEKTGRREAHDISHLPAVQRGIQLEPVARASYELETGNETPPAFFVHDEKDWMRASLDGYGHIGPKTVVLEIKCPQDSSTTLALAKEGKVDPAYIPQLAHQQMVTGADIVHFYVFDGTRGYLVEYNAEFEYLAKLKKAEEAFWACVVNDTPPESKYETPKDKEQIELLDRLAFLLREIKDNPDPREVELERLKKKAQETFKSSVQYGQVMVVFSDKKNIDYKKVMADFNVKPELYTTVSQSISVRLRK